MHIGFRRSGGRGEYEVVGHHGSYSARNLEGWSFDLLWPNGRRYDTNLVRESASSGKPRLRSQLPRPLQIGRAIAGMLLLPRPTRDFSSVSTDREPIRDQRYIISEVGFGSGTNFDKESQRVSIDPTWVKAENLEEQVILGVQARCGRINTVINVHELLPPVVRSAVLNYSKAVSESDSLSHEVVDAAFGVMQSLQRTTEARYDGGGDPLVALEELLNIEPRLERDGPEIPTPERIGEFEPEINSRSAHEYRLSKARGSGAARFSRKVRRAYSNRCAFCGVVLGGVEGIASGIDAAHILAWSDFDLDVVPNGMALCKLHHWSFDAGIQIPWYSGGRYQVRFTALAWHLDQESRDMLGVDGQEIPEERLPADTSEWPSSRYLEKLYADLAVEFM